VLRVYLDIFVIVYLDDILIYLENEVEYLEHVRIVLTLLREHALMLDPNKYQWHQEELEFLGCTVGKHGVKMSPDKIKVVKEWLILKNVKDI
jgi:hypothetical protein